MLRKVHRRQLLRYPATGSPMPAEQLVFSNAEGAALSPAYVSRHFPQLIAQQGLPRIRSTI
jgi:hypothetical protein